MRYYPRLRDLREDMDLTQDELVKILNMHKTTYTKRQSATEKADFTIRAPMRGKWLFK